MNISAHMIIVLTVVCLFSGLSLVYMNQYAEPLIKINNEKAMQEAIFKVLPDVANVEPVAHDEIQIFKGLDGEGSLVGYAFVAQGSGYQGVIKIMAGIDANLEKLTGIDILESVETPGLGAKITEEGFRDQFKKVSVLPAIAYVKGKPPENENEIQAITGATVSSRSVVNILNTTIAAVKETVGDAEPKEDAEPEGEHEPTGEGDHE
jgi:electron transport complex protein RnfG